MGMFEYSNLPPGLSQDNIEKDLITKGFYQMPQHEGSSLINSATSQVLNTSSIDVKIKEIGYVLQVLNNITDFEITYFDPRRLTYRFSMIYEGYRYSMDIDDETLRCAPVEYIVNEITEILQNFINSDPEYLMENENEQAMLDAAMDYGFV